jgi:TonB family protein
MKALFLSVLVCAVTGCASTRPMEGGDAGKAAVSARGVAHGPIPQSQSKEDERARLAELFSDRPQYVALALRNDSNDKLPRLRTSLPPKYPFGLMFTDTKALVRVALVISESGAVEAARIYESTDPRFSDEALDVARDWTFYSGTREGAASKFVMIMPVEFGGRQK